MIFTVERKTCWSWRILLAVLPLLALMLAQVGDGAAAEVSGVYAVQDPGHPFPDDIMNNPNVDGLALRYPWFALERSEGVYNWGFIDQEIARDMAHGKKISITISPGRFTPPWVINQGVRLYSFSWRLRGQGPCRNIQIPVPWDPILMNKWETFVRAFGARYYSNPAIVSIKIQGVQANTPELILPHSGPWGGCPYSDRNANWQQVGYTRTRVLQTWQAYAETYAQAFPNKGLVQEVIPDGLPPIDDQGRLTSGRFDEVAVPQLIALGMREFGARFVIQNDGISARWNWDLLAQYGNRATVGYQMLWFVTGDPQCRMNGGSSPCDAVAVQRAALERAIGAGASYVELYPPDLENPAMQGVIADAHRRLTSRNPVLSNASPWVIAGGDRLN